MKPNIIIFLTDQQRYDSLGAYGNPLDLTPNFDGWSKRGTLCENAFTPQPICGPARACIQTGLYATQNGCYRNGIPFKNRPNHSIAQIFRQNGYRTCYIGKWHLAAAGIVDESERAGYENWLGSNELEFSSDGYDLVMYNEENQPVKIPGHRIDGVVDRAIQYIDQNQNEPFVLFVSLIEPHCQNCSNSYAAPLFTEERLRGRWMPPDLLALGGTAAQHISGYLALVQRIDAAFGRMMDALVSLDLLKKTTVLYTSDHGEHFMTRNSTNKMSPHEVSIHVPMLWCGYDFDMGRRLRQPVSLIDILPTLLDCAHIEFDKKLAGRSIRPLLYDPNAEWRDSILIQISETEVGRAIRTRDWKYVVRAPGLDAFRDISAEYYEESELYDLRNDPYELMNLIHHDGYENLKKELRSKLIELILESGECAPQIGEAEIQSFPDGILPQMFYPDESKLEDISDPRRYMK